MKIAIVDDNSLVRRTIREFIEDADDEVSEYDSGESLIHDLNDKILNPDWILLDIKMRGINGFDTAELIKKINPHWHIGFITNYDLSAYRRKAKELDAELFVSKQNMSGLKEIIKNKSF